jgi:hypothetical protein
MQGFYGKQQQRVYEYDAEITIAQITSSTHKGGVAARMRLFHNRDRPTEMVIVAQHSSGTAAMLKGLSRICDHLKGIDNLKVRVWSYLDATSFEAQQPKLFKEVTEKFGTNRIENGCHSPNKRKVTQ